jgi:phosphatidylinositol-3-phosphatase
MKMIAAVTVLAALGFLVGSSLQTAGADPNCKHSHAPQCQTTSSTTTTTTTTPPPTGPCGSLATLTAPSTVAHVVWVWMENHSYSEIIGSSSAPYINSLAAKCGLATNYTAITHPSLPNYIAATSGSTQGITDDNPPSSHPLSAASIFGQVSSASYQESMPSNCDLTDAYPYAVKHNPEAYYTTIRTACQSNDVPLGSLNASNLPAFSFVTPNLCNDMHDCSVSTGDRWLQNFIPKLTSTTDYQAGRTVVVITWDEDDGSSGNHVATLVLNPYVPAGLRISTAFNHYSLLRTTEELLGAGPLGNASGAASMRVAFHL